MRSMVTFLSALSIFAVTEGVEAQCKSNSRARRAAQVDTTPSVSVAQPVSPPQVEWRPLTFSQVAFLQRQDARREFRLQQLDYQYAAMERQQAAALRQQAELRRFRMQQQLAQAEAREEKLARRRARVEARRAETLAKRERRRQENLMRLEAGKAPRAEATETALLNAEGTE